MSGSAISTTVYGPRRRTCIGPRTFIRFHGLRHPAGMGGPEVEAFLSWLVTSLKVSTSTHKQALSRPCSSSMHGDVTTTMISTHVLKVGGSRVRSPVDSLP